MKNLSNALVGLFLLSFLTACQSNQTVPVEVRYITPPEVYLTPCERQFKDNTVKEVLLGLDKTSRCYESKQDNLKDWYKDIKGEQDAEV